MEINTAAPFMITEASKFALKALFCNGVWEWRSHAFVNCIFWTVVAAPILEKTNLAAIRGLRSRNIAVYRITIYVQGPEPYPAKIERKHFLQS